MTPVMHSVFVSTNGADMNHLLPSLSAKKEAKKEDVESATSLPISAKGRSVTLEEEVGEVKDKEGRRVMEDDIHKKKSAALALSALFNAGKDSINEKGRDKKTRPRTPTVTSVITPSSSSERNNKKKRSSPTLYQRAVIHGQKKKKKQKISAKKEDKSLPPYPKSKIVSTPETRRSASITSSSPTNSGSNHSDESSLNTRFLQSQESLSSFGSPNVLSLQQTKSNKFSSPPYLARPTYYQQPSPFMYHHHHHHHHHRPYYHHHQSPQQLSYPPFHSPESERLHHQHSARAPIVSPYHHPQPRPPHPIHSIHKIPSNEKVKKSKKNKDAVKTPQAGAHTNFPSAVVTPLSRIPPHPIHHVHHPYPSPYYPPPHLHYHSTHSFLHKTPDRPPFGSPLLNSRAATPQDKVLSKSLTPPLNSKLKNTPSKTASLSNQTSYSRKDKSLGLLCENFISTYSGKNSSALESRDICIDIAAATLGVERRRIYDIINILEAVHIVSRKCKNTYYWHGTDNLKNTFCQMQKEAFLFWKDDAIKSGLLSSEKNSVKTTANDTEKKKCGIRMLLQSAQEAATKDQEQTPIIRPYSEKLKNCNSNGSNYPINKPNLNIVTNAKEKSLGKLSQKFIQLFLVGYDVISLTEASDKILGPDKKKFEHTPPPTETRTKQEEEAEAKRVAASAARGMKTKIRRLYDIANVMVSIGVIDKINSGNMNNCLKNRPSFRWVYSLSPQDIRDLNQSDLDGKLPAEPKDAAINCLSPKTDSNDAAK